MLHSLVKGDLDAIETHVKKVYEYSESLRTEKMKRTPLKGVTNSLRHISFTNLPITIRQDVLRSISLAFRSGPAEVRTLSEEDVERLRASCAYEVYGKDVDKASWRFPWNVAFDALCDISAKARPGTAPGKTVAADVYPFLSVDRAALK